MRRPVLLLFVVTCTAPAAAQVRVGVHAGLVASTNLVRDSIGGAVLDIRPNLAPLVGLEADVPVDPAFRLGVRVELSHSDLVDHERGGDVALTPLTIWYAGATLAHRLTPHLEARGNAGITAYQPAQDVATIFQGDHPVRPGLGLAIRGDTPLGRDLRLAVGLGWDVHQFTTTALRQAGFVGKTLVHRFALTLTLSWSRVHPAR